MNIPENKVKLMWLMKDDNNSINSELLSHQSYIKGELDKSPSITKSLEEFKEGWLEIYSGDGKIMHKLYSFNITLIQSFSYSIVRAEGYDYFVGFYVKKIDGSTLEVLTDGTIYNKD